MVHGLRVADRYISGLHQAVVYTRYICVGISSPVVGDDWYTLILALDVVA